VAVELPNAVDVEEAKPPAGTPRATSRRSDLVQRYALPAVWGLLILFFSFLLPNTFPSTGNFSTIFGSQGVSLVLTLGLLVTLTVSDYDLSIAYNANLAAMIIAILNVSHHWPIVPAILAALTIGAAVGFINGGIITLFGIDSLIVTLGTGTFIQGVIFWVSNSNTIPGVSSGLVNFVVVKRLFGIPLQFYYGVVLCAIIWYVFEFTPLGRRLLIVGRGRNVARLSGLHVMRIRWGAMTVSGLIAGLAGVLYVGTTGAADPTSGASFLLPAFAAAFLGATTIMPGRFNPWGAFVATYFLVTGITGLQLLGVQSFVQQLFYGGALVVSVALSQLARRRQALDTGAGS
jgi:ribose transport system permease protein